jgi:hypothetical protein
LADIGWVSPGEELVEAAQVRRGHLHRGKGGRKIGHASWFALLVEVVGADDDRIG